MLILLSAAISLQGPTISSQALYDDVRSKIAMASTLRVHKRIEYIDPQMMTTVTDVDILAKKPGRFRVAVIHYGRLWGLHVCDGTSRISAYEKRYRKSAASTDIFGQLTDSPL